MAPDASGPVIGETLAGYRVSAVLEPSGSAPLLRATRIADGQDVVLKVLDTANTAGVNLEGTIWIDAVRLHGVRTAVANVPTAVGSRRNHRGRLALQPLELWSLGELVARHGRPSVAEAVSMIARLARALIVPHRQKLFYASIRPEEILCAYDGESLLCVFRHELWDAGDRREGERGTRTETLLCQSASPEVR